MSFHAMVLRRSHLTLIFLGLTASHAIFGQAANSPIVFANQEAITTSFVSAPNLGDSSVGGGSSDKSQWLKVEFHYSVTPTVGDYLDSAEFKVWIEGRDLLDPQGKPGEGIAVGLTGSVTYINILKNKDTYGVFYVHPSTLGRYSDRGGSEDFDRKYNIHIEAYVAGNKVDYFDKKKDKDGPNWFQSLKAVSGLVYRQDQCAFIVSNPDHYPAIKLPAASGQ